MQALPIMAIPPPDRRLLETTERYGLGQSGYTAGRREGEPALEREIEARNRGYPRGSDEHMLELGLDERWTARGGSRWYPEPSVETIDEQKIHEQRTARESPQEKRGA